MAEIVDITAKRESPHMTGKARCIACGHEEVAVAPVGVVWMECSECHTMKLLFRHAVCDESRLHWTCACGNDLFHATPEGFYCPNCGEWQKGF